MITLKSKLSVLENKSIIDLAHVDLIRDDAYMLISELAMSKNTDGVVLNLSEIEVLTSDDFHRVAKLVRAVEVTGMPVVVCGVNPQSALVISAFITDISVRTELNVNYAVQSFRN